MQFSRSHRRSCRVFTRQGSISTCSLSPHSRGCWLACSLVSGPLGEFQTTNRFRSRCTKQAAAARATGHAATRSEEHTSELQSHSDLVCRLLLEKKKTKTIT